MTHNVIIGTAGHVDHGKTWVIKALTGVDTDRLQEEKKRGITIELGFASLPNDEGLKIGIIDVPGHEKFVKNMLAGIGGIDLVLLIIGLDEGVMPQTREHFEILNSRRKTGAGWWRRMPGSLSKGAFSKTRRRSGSRRLPVRT